MSDLHLQLSNSSQSVISYFTNAQDEAEYPNQVILDSSDPKWKIYYDSLVDGFIKDGLPKPD